LYTFVYFGLFPDISRTSCSVTAADDTWQPNVIYGHLLLMTAKCGCSF